MCYLLFLSLPFLPLVILTGKTLAVEKFCERGKSNDENQNKKTFVETNMNLIE